LTAGLPYVVWMAPTSWDGIPGTDRPLAMALTRYARVLWVDPPVSPVTPARLRGQVSGGLRPSVRDIGEGLTRLTPVALPGLTRPGIRATTAPLVRAQVRWALRKLGIQPFAMVAGYLEDLLGRWGDAVNVVYSTDDHVAGAELMGLSADRIRAQERLAAAHADVVVVVSPHLAGHWAALGSVPPVLIPNGSFPAYTGGVSPAPAVSDMPGPVVGLIGQLTPRIDLGMLNAVADAGYSLLLVGPYDARWERDGFAALTAPPNVRYAGRVPAEAVPSYLASIDVGLIPYSSSAFNRASFPMKTLEYFSAGLPVVSTDLPGSQWLRDSLASSDPAHADQLMALTSDPGEFVAAVRRLAGGPGSQAGPRGAAAPGPEPSRSAAARTFAGQHSWPRRADAFAEAIGLRTASTAHPATV
jgi:teichuronic acid biosynthesis glycosyltransferase TuaH